MMVLALARRNAMRNPQRTLITATMVLLGTALLVVGMTWLYGLFGNLMKEGVDQMGHVRVVDPGYAAREPLMPLYENIPDAQAVLDVVTTVQGVTDAWAIISAPVTLTAGEEIGDVFGLAVGADPAWFEQRMGLKKVLTEGAWFGDGPDDVLVGQVIAERAGLKVGDEIRIIGQTQDGAISPILGHVAGIVHAGNALVDQKVFLPLAQMEWLTDIPGGAIEVLAYTDDFEDAPAIAKAMRATPALEGLEVQAWDEREPFAGFMGIIATVRGVIISVIVILTSLGVLNTMMMSVLERTHEIGVLRAMGLSRIGVVSLFVIEAAVIASLGGLGGVALGSIGGWALETYGITLGEQVSQGLEVGIPIKATMYGDLSWGIVEAGFGLGLVMALLGSLLPALRAAAIEPVVAMRSGR